ncbi:MAG: O-antigen ligase family protein [Gammaproteobacteria bacterium]|nr:O-antigen ligase family protein [Gammaproteobacteria bacterium]
MTHPAESANPIEYSRLQQFSQQTSFYCTLAFAFFIPISPALMNLFLFFTLIFVLLSGNLKEHWHTAWSNPVARGGILLFLLFMAGTTWSIVDYSEALKGLKKYNELWYIALLLPLFNTEKRKELGINTFLASMTFILVIVYSIYFGLMDQMQVPISEGHTTIISVDGGFRTHIITNILMSFAVFIFAQRALLKKGVVRGGYIVLFVASFYYTLFISTGTTGQILVIGLIALLFIQHWRWKSAAIIPLFIGAIFSYGQYNTHTSINHAINKMIGGVEHDGGSASQRREFVTNSLYLIQENLWLGSGTGSVSQRYSEIPRDRIRTNITTNPHNEYAATALQLGLIGIIGLLLLFSTQYRQSRLINSLEHRYIAQGLITFIIVASFGNSMLMDAGEGHFWIFFVALLFASNKLSPTQT